MVYHRIFYPWDEHFGPPFEMCFYKWSNLGSWWLDGARISRRSLWSTLCWEFQSLDTPWVSRRHVVVHDVAQRRPDCTTSSSRPWRNGRSHPRCHVAGWNVKVWLPAYQNISQNQVLTMNTYFQNWHTPPEWNWRGWSWISRAWTWIQQHPVSLIWCWLVCCELSSFK